ncbi:MAG: ketopantoate reductase family protein, partial [Nitrospirota bacterium]
KALDTIQSVVSKDTMILTIQNGIDGEEEILHRFPDANVLGGVAFLASKIEEPGIISHIGAGSLGIGELDGSESERARSLVDLFKNAGIPTRLSRNIYKTKWEKLCWNSVFNPLSVILNGPLDNILDSKDALDVAYKIFEEIRLLAEKKGISIDSGLMDEQINVTQKLRGYHTSMYEDFSKGKPTEIDYFNGYVCREGVRSNVATPVNYTVTSLVKAIIFRHKTAG